MLESQVNKFNMLDIILAYIEYDKHAKITEGNLPILKLLEVSASDYPDFIELDHWKSRKIIRFQPYLRAKVEETFKNVDIAIRTDIQTSQRIEKIVTEPSGYQYQKYIAEDDTTIYYIPPRCWEPNQYTGIPQETISGHYTSVGNETIKIYFSDQKEESITLISEFQIEEKDFYKAMFDDLIGLYQQLCMDSKSSMSMAINWSRKMYEETKKLIDDFYEAFLKIEKNPESELKPYHDKLPFHKVKKITVKTLIDQNIVHKNKVSTVSYKKDYDTYEHRVIKNYIEKLITLLNVRKQMELRALECEQQKLDIFSQPGLEEKLKELKIESNLILQKNLEEKIHSLKHEHKTTLDTIKNVKNIKESLGFYEEMLENSKKSSELDKRINTDVNQQWGELEQKLDEIKHSNLMREVKDVRTSLKTTNLFMFHPNYKKIYQVMITHINQIAGVEYYSPNTDDEFQVAKLCDIYEVWCCLKLVLIFINVYSFEFISVTDITDNRENKGIEGLRNYIQKILSQGTLSGARFDLKDDKLNMNVSIWYDREIKIDREKLMNMGIFPSKKGKSTLRPDILMKIRYNLDEKLFVFDAKYRRRRNYDGIKDLCEVALQKYTLELGNGMDAWSEFGTSKPATEYISGSFIIHSNNHNLYEYKKEMNGKMTATIQYDAGNYLGTYPDAFIDKWIAQCQQKNWRISENHAREWAKWFPDTSNNENKIGIIVANPHNNNMTYLLQMIMEHHFGLYQKKCWLCGSDNIDIEEKETENGYKKYHIKCQNKECNAFSVETHCFCKECPSHDTNQKLGKHFKNYYASASKSNWNVSCPTCRGMLHPYTTYEVPIIVPPLEFLEYEDTDDPFS